MCIGIQGDVTSDVVPAQRLLQIVLPDVGCALMFEAYFDESGTHQHSPLMCVAGYLIESDQCRRFQSDWDGILKRHGVPYFHMSDCAHGSGVFKGIPSERRATICQSLIELIKLRVEIGIAVSVSEADYLAAMPPGFKVDAYSFCLQYCMQGVVAWAERFSYTGPIAYVFEAGHKHQNTANNLIEFTRTIEPIVTGLRYDSHSFVSGKSLCGIAAADLLAWEWMAAYRNKFGPVRRSPRLSLRNLMNKNHIVMHFRQEDMQDFADQMHAFGRGERMDIPEKFRRFLGTRTFPEKPLGTL